MRGYFYLPPFVISYCLINSLKVREKVDEKLKANDPIKWVQMMNNLQNRAREIVLNEVIYL